MASSKKTLGSLELEDVRKSRIVRHSRSGMMEPVVAHFTAGISSGYCKPNASAISTLSRSLLKENAGMADSSLCRWDAYHWKH